MRISLSKRFWVLGVFIFLILGVCLYSFIIFLRIAPKQGKNIFLIDDFEHNPMQNILGNTTGTYQQYPSRIDYRLTQKSYYQGEGRYLMINYDQKVSSNRNASGGWCGYYTTLVRYKGMDMEYFDTTPYDYLSFFVKGKNGGEKFTVGIADEDYYARKDSLKLEEIGKYLKRGKVTTKWQKAVIPLDNYSIDRRTLASIGISFDEYLFQEEGGKGTVYIDNLAFVKDPRSLPAINYPTKKLIAKAKVTRPKNQISSLAVFLQSLRKRHLSYTVKSILGRCSKINTNWFWSGFRIIGVLLLFGLSLIGGIRLYSFLFKERPEHSNNNKRWQGLTLWR